MAINPEAQRHHDALFPDRESILLSDLSSYTTGTDLDVDGGCLLRE